MKKEIDDILTILSLTPLEKCYRLIELQEKMLQRHHEERMLLHTKTVIKQIALIRNSKEK